MDTKELGILLRGLRQKQRLSIRRAAKDAKISATYLWQVEKGDRSPSAEILKKIAPVYAVTVQELLEAAGYLERPSATTSDTERLKWAVEAIASDPAYRFGARLDVNELTPEVMRFILEVYEKTTGKKLL